MVTCVDDVIEELTPIVPRKEKVEKETRAPEKGNGPVSAAVARKSPSRTPEVKLTVEEALVLRQVQSAGTTVDAVARAAQLPSAKVNALLVALRLKGRIRFLPGNRVASR